MRKKSLHLLLVVLAVTTSARVSFAQQDQQQPQPPLPPSVIANPSAPAATITPPSDYVLGRFDQIAVLVGEFPDQFGKQSFRIDGQGDVSLPLVGRVHAAGLTLSELEASIKGRLGSFLKYPDVVVNLTDFSSQTVSVLGAVKNPGPQKLLGTNNLFSVLSLAGGLDGGAGTTVKITRESRWGPIPCPDTIVDPSGKFSTAIVHIKQIAQTGTESLTIMPGDTIFVPKADVVYAVGSVVKPGGFVIGENEALSALQVVSLAGGLAKAAAGDKARILRVVPHTASRTEITVNIKQLMAGRTADIPLEPDDILFIPNSGAKSVGYRTVDAIVASTGALLLYGSRF